MKKYLIDIYNTINKLPAANQRARLHEPFFFGKEKEYLNDCIQTTFVSTSGKYIKQFENKLANFTKAKNAIAVINGQAGLEISLRVLGVKDNDEILIPSITFVATAFAVSHCNAIPHFIDSNKNNLGICHIKLKKYLSKNLKKKGNYYVNKKTKRRVFAIIPVHVFGHIANMDEIKKISKFYKLKVIEDAAEAIGSYYKNKHAGTIGDVGVISFNANKTITSGGGGIILTNNNKLAKKISYISNNSKEKHNWSYLHKEIGWNFRLPNLNAAVGLAQLKNLKKILKYKKDLASYYKKKFTHIKNIEIVKGSNKCKSNNWLNAIKVNFKTIKERNNFLNEIIKKHECRPLWTLLHKLPMYSRCPRDKMQTAISLEKKIITLPSGAKYGKNLLKAKA
tara:strand:- start:31 stop:1212 length:1182 start_codon:yes stop_codon:yes gene_type:complete